MPALALRSGQHLQRRLVAQVRHDRHAIALTPGGVVHAIVHSEMRQVIERKGHDTVQFAEVVYVLHAFQKKSKAGIKTPQDEVKLIGERLKRAQQDFERTRTS